MSGIVGGWGGVSYAALLHAHSLTRGPAPPPPPRFFFTKDKMLCANPRDSWVQKVMVSLDAGNNTLSKHHWRHLHGG